MPLYEYRCQQCRHTVTILVRGSSPVSCPHCGSTELDRLLSSFRVKKSDSQVYDDILSDSQLVKGLMRDDSRALAEWNKRMTGGEKAATEYEDMLGHMAAGEMPGPSTRKKETDK